MEETQEARRKRLKALQASAGDHTTAHEATVGAKLPKPLLDSCESAPSIPPQVFRSALPRPVAAPPPPPHAPGGPGNRWMQQAAPRARAFVPSPHHVSYGQCGRGRQSNWQQGSERWSNRGGRLGGRGGRGHREQANIESYLSPEMISNPWAHLEGSRLHGATHRAEGEDEEGSNDVGRATDEGALDRPWH